MAQSDLKTLLSLWAPVVLGAACIFLGITLAWEGEFKFSFNIGFIGISRDFTEGHVTRAAFFFLAFLAFLFPAFRDYSPFFPNYYKMTVKFDYDGIIKALKEFSSAEKADFNLMPEWWLEKQRYLDLINDLLKEKGKSEFRIEWNTVAEGETTFFPHKVKRSLQTYEIGEAHGSITLQRAQGDVPDIESQFTLWNAKKIEASLIDVYFRWTMIIRPQFKQHIQMGLGLQNRVTLDRAVTVMTKVRFFPFVKLGTSVYLLSVEDCASAERISQNVPVAYATYDAP